MNSLRLPPDAPEAVRRQRRRLLVLVGLGAVAATIAAARFIVSLKDPFAGLRLRATIAHGGVTTQASIAPPATPPEHPKAQPPLPTPEVEPPPPEPRLAPKAPPPATPPQGQVVVQLAAFRQQARANSLARRATRAGFPSSVKRARMADGSLIFRVRVDQALEGRSALVLVIALKSKMPDLRPILVPHGIKG